MNAQQTEVATRACRLVTANGQLIQSRLNAAVPGCIPVLKGAAPPVKPGAAPIPVASPPAKSLVSPPAKPLVPPPAPILLPVQLPPLITAAPAPATEAAAAAQALTLPTLAPVRSSLPPAEADNSELQLVQTALLFLLQQRRS